MYEVGAAKKDITAFHKGVGMMGYGMHWNRVEDVETPLHVRAYFFRHSQSGETAVVAVCEMAFMTISVKNGVMKKLNRKHPELGLKEETVMLLAQHTHSGPGGYSHYGLYNVTIPGFVPAVYQEIVEGIVDAIVEAAENRSPANISLDSAEFHEDIPVAFNRSMKAYLRNPDAKPLKKEDAHLAIEREMTLMRFDGLDGEQIGAINWFGVHTTSVHNDNKSICWDNKGYAADFMERDVRQAPNASRFLGAFAQGSAGDVTPNSHWDKKKKWTRGPFEDDFESARFSGRLQYEHARKIYDAAPHAHQVSGGLDGGLIHVNFSNVLCSPEFSNGQLDARTGPACHGLAFFAGTVEGPGMPPIVAFVAKGLSKIVKAYELGTNFLRKKARRTAIRQKYKLHGVKNIIIEAGERRVLGTSNIRKLIVPGFADPTIHNLKTLHPRGWDENKPWTPHVLPLQILILGDIALVGIPAEPTTIAAQRIKKVIEDVLLSNGIHRVLIAPYANAYCGYISTFEEYQVQMYEGGHTVFGQWTLAAFQTKFKQLAEEMAKKAHFRELLHDENPPEFTPEELERRSFPRMVSGQSS
jgi:neutral ceramidase